MDVKTLTEDELDRLLVRAESEIGLWRAVEMAAVMEMRRRGSHRADGHRSIVDWVAARADISHETARRICWTGSRLEEAPDVAADLAAGDMSFDRAEQLARLPAEHRQGHEALDIGQLRRRVAHYRRLTRSRETKISNGFLNFATAPDELMTSVWGELPGFDARLVEKAVDQRADEIVDSVSGLGVAERRALALVAICQDSLYDIDPDQETSAPVEMSVVMDASAAASTGGEAGVSVLAGPRVGSRFLEEILCNGLVALTGIGESGVPLNLGRASRTVDRRLRRIVLDRDGGCTAEGCPSHYRLEVHHVIPWSKGGPTDTENLITLCWFHHHIAVHREGLEVERVGTSRVRLKRPH